MVVVKEAKGNAASALNYAKYLVKPQEPSFSNKVSFVRESDVQSEIASSEQGPQKRARKTQQQRYSVPASNVCSQAMTKGKGLDDQQSIELSLYIDNICKELGI